MCPVETAGGEKRFLELDEVRGVSAGSHPLLCRAEATAIRVERGEPIVVMRGYEIRPLDIAGQRGRTRGKTRAIAFNIDRTDLNRRGGLGLVKLEVDVLALLYRLVVRSEEHTSELQSLMRISYAVFCLTKKK